MTSAITARRLALQAAGFSPIPVQGKSALLPEWPTKTDASAAEIASWAVKFAHCTNTGILTRNTPALDDDIRHPEAAAAVEDLARARFDGYGVFLTRFGETPKRAMLFRTEQPFPKIRADFEAPDGSMHKIEVLCDGQQIVVDGIHPDTKKPYAWHADRQPWTIPRSDLPEIDEAEAQAFVIQAGKMLQEQFGFRQIQISGHTGDTPETAHKSIDVGEELAGIRYGNINDTWSNVMGSMLRKGVPADDVFYRLLTATQNSPACQADPKRETWARGLADMMTRYMHSEAEFVFNLSPEMQINWHKVASAGNKPRLAWREDLGQFGRLYVRRAGKDAEGPSGGDGGGRAQSKAEKPDGGRRVLKLRPFRPFDVAALPPRSWLYGRHYQRRTVSLTAGPGGMGKSSMDMVEAVAMATARNLLGEQPEERLRVWYHNGEDPLDEVYRRLAAICQYYTIPQEELQDYLWVTSGTEFPLRVAKGYTNIEIDAALVQQISTAIADNQIDLAMFDPFVTLHSVSEVDTGKMDAVVRLFAGIADENDAAIEIAHHVRKPAAGSSADYDVHDIRGVGAITDAVRAARLLNRMNEKDAEAAGCSELERLSRFRVDRAKGNYSAAQVATWRQFVSVELPNNDDVGVVAPWHFPGQGEQTEEKAAAEQNAEHVFLQLLDKFVAREENVSTSTGKNFAPTLFAKEREAKAAKVSKAALEAAMRRLLDANKIHITVYGPPSRPLSGSGLAKRMTNA